MSGKLSLRISRSDEVGPGHSSLPVVRATEELFPVFLASCVAHGGLATLSGIASILATVARTNPDWTPRVVQVLRDTADVVERAAASSARAH